MTPAAAVYRGFPQTLITGTEAVASLAQEIERNGYRRVALLSSPSVAAGGSFSRVRGQLQGAEIVETFTEVRPHAPIADTEALAARLAVNPPEAIVALGGGSVSDTAKACSILLAEGGRLEEHCSTFTPPDRLVAPDLPHPKIPVLAVPTTLSGAEMTPGGGATNADGVKRVFWDAKVAVSVAVFDPGVLAETPRGLVVATAMNGLAHCAEGLYSRTKNPVSTGLALRGAQLFAGGLTRLAQSADPDEPALMQLAEAAALGGMVISHARVGLHHAVCHVLGAYCGVGHGTANAVMLPYVLRYNEPATVTEQRALAAALVTGLNGAGASPGLPTGDAAAADRVAELEQIAGAPRSLRSVGVAEHDLPEVAQRTMSDRGLFFNPRRVEDVAEVLGILERAWDGDHAGV
jgi:alcohol dehydrogenase